MPQTESWTIGQLLTWTTDYLKQHGAESPRLDAEVLLAESLGCERISLYAGFDRSVDEEHRATFRQFVRRRADGEPVAYLVGHREFYSLPLEVSPAVLIPRPETEHLVVETLDLIRQRPAGDRPVRILDVGTGSGAIAVSLACHAPTARITAVDISDTALDVAHRNVQRHDVVERVELLSSDLIGALDESLMFEFVVSNPPYVTRQEWEQLATEVRDHEPYVALVAGETGVETIARLVPQAAQHLVSGGWLLMEISPMIEQAVLATIESDGRFESVAVSKDLAGHARVVKAQRS